MLRILFGASLLKIIVIFINLAIPAIVIRYYSPYDFGMYSYFLAYAIVVSIIQNGITASYRNRISHITKDEMLAYLLYTARKLSVFVVGVIVVGMVCVLLFLDYHTMQVKVVIFILSTFINLFYPLVSSYFDASAKTIKFCSYEILFSLSSLLIVYFLSLSDVNVLLVCIATANYRGIYALCILVYKYVHLSYRNKCVTIISDKSAIFGYEDACFFVIQVVNVVNSLLFMNLLARYYGIIAFGIFSLYFRFISFPQQIVGFSSSLIWIRFRQAHYSDTNKSSDLLIKLFLTFLGLVLAWIIVVQFVMKEAIYLYSSKNLVYPGELLLINVMVALTLMKDFSSIILNAVSLFKLQIVLSILMLALNACFYNFTYVKNFDSAYIISISLYLLLCVIINLISIKYTVFKK